MALPAYVAQRDRSSSERTQKEDLVRARLRVEARGRRARLGALDVGEPVPSSGCQPAGLVAERETGLMWANMLRACQVGKAHTSGGTRSTWMPPSRVAWAQVCWPACHLTKASASAVM